MIKIQQLTNGRMATVLVCDSCEQVITDHKNANVSFSRNAGKDSAPVYHVHKGQCDAALSKRIGPLAWGDVALHFSQLCSNVGLTSSDFIAQDDPLSPERF